MADELAITKITDSHPVGGWMTDEAWTIIAQLQPGEELELTSLLKDGYPSSRAVTVLRFALARFGFSQVRASLRDERVFARHRERRDGA